MLNRYREVDACKKDIEDFICMVSSENLYIVKEDLTSIAKGITFIKKVYAYQNAEHEHYYNCLITDMISLIHSFSLNSLRVYYITLRSLIENLLRVMLKYNNVNATGVRKMFEEFHSKYKNTDNFIDYVEGEYGKCCEVVHSNHNTSMPMYFYYQDILKNDELGQEKVSQLLKQLVTFFNKCKKYIVDENINDVDNAFYSQKEVLYYLLGKKNYELFEKNIQES